MKKLLMIVVLFFVALPAWPQKKAFTIEDFYRIKYLGTPQVSPDGKKIAFTVTSSDLYHGKQHTHIYLMDADGKNLRQFTQGKSSEWEPCWAPGGKELGFLSNRKGNIQFWTIPADGGEARCRSLWSMGMSGVLWSPDGRQVAFVSEVFPECGNDSNANAELGNNIAGGPVRGYLADRLLYRHWDSWKQGKRNHILLLDVASEMITDLTPGDYDSPPFSLWGGIDYDFSPDGKELCFVRNDDPHPESSTNSDLWLLRLPYGKPKKITGSNRAYDGTPRYSPDGRYIAYRRQAIPGYESDRFCLAIYDRQSKQSRVITSDFDNWVNDFQWASDSRHIYFSADVAGYVPLYRVDIVSRQIVTVIAKANISSFTLSPHHNQVFFCHRTMEKPGEIYSCSSDGSNCRQLTFINKALGEQVDIRPSEQMWVAGEDGVKIHVFIVKPHNFEPGRKYPLILNVHGGPQQQWTDGFRGDWQVYPGAGYVVAFANPRGSTGYGQKFTAAISGDWGGKVFRDLMAVTDALEKLPYVDKTRMGAMGWSYGGYMMAWFAGHTTRFKALASMMGVYDLRSKYGATEELWFPEWDLHGAPWNSDLYEKWSPSRYVESFKTPCLVITGMRDFRVPYTQSLQFFTALQKRGVPSRLIVFENDGHWPNHVRSMPVYYNAHLEWFHKYLGGAPAPWKTRDMMRNTAFTRKAKK